MTRRWRKTDSNHRSLSGRIPLFRLVLPAGGVEEACSEKPPVLGGGPAVRIRLPPALSPLRTSFSGGKRGKVRRRQSGSERAHSSQAQPSSSTWQRSACC